MAFWTSLGEIASAGLNMMPRMSWIPRWNQGVLSIRGRKIRTYEGGLLCYWPWWTEKLEVTKAWTRLKVGPVPLTTSDDQSFVAEAIMRYRVVDPVRFLVENDSAWENLDDDVSSCLQALTTLTWEELLEQDKEVLNQHLLTQALEDLAGYGIDIQFVRLRALARTRVITMSGGESHYIPDEEAEE